MPTTWVSKAKARQIANLSRREQDQLLAEGLLSTRTVLNGRTRVSLSEAKALADEFVKPRREQPACLS
jgi:hypothetical protein